MTEPLGSAHRRRWQDALATTGAGLPSTSECPAPERIWEAARGHLDSAAVRELLDHTSGCSGCSLAWRLAVEVDSAGEETIAEAFPRRPGLLRIRAFAATVVGLALLASLLLLLTRGLDGGRNHGAGEELRQGGGAEIRSLVEGQSLAREDCVLRWTPVPETLAYSILVGDSDLDVLARDDGLDQPEFRVLPEALQDVPSGTSLVWRVEARLEDGNRVRSPSFVNPLR